MAITPTNVELKNRFVAMMDHAINNHPLQQNEIADRIGYSTNPNIMSGLKRGLSRLPPNKVRPLALVLDQDPAVWMRLWIQAYMPDCLEDLEATLGEPMSRAEKSWLVGLRAAFGGKLPMFKPSMVSMPVKTS